MFICSNCQVQFNKWSGMCENCQQWGTVSEHNGPSLSGKKEKQKKSPQLNKVVKLHEVEEKTLSKIPTGYEELDELLGGGITRGSLILLGGEPGIGKSTFALQIANALATKNNQHIFYVSGEETARQLKQRADRLSITEENFSIYNNPIVEEIIQNTLKDRPHFTIIDSIQTIYSGDIPNETGSPTQIRASAHKLLEFHKAHDLTTLIIGQVTKDGAIAGPKMLEHLVDVVFYLEGEKDSDIRIMRSVKNRFGPSNEICLFKMQNTGLKAVNNINEDLIEIDDDLIAGSTFTAISDTNKIFIVEIQSLVTPTVFGYPQRKTNGIDANRLQILSAVISKFSNTKVQNSDIHLNISGGQKSKDTGFDLAIAAAIFSSAQNIALPKQWLFLGEIGLGGEIKNVKNLSSKIKEAEKLGFSQIFIPQKQLKNTSSTKLNLVGVKNIAELENRIKNLIPK